MIDKNVLDEVLPIPEIQDLKNEIVSELEEEGFAVTNFSSGGIFNMLLMIVLQIRIELIKLIRIVLSNMFIKHATGKWLELKSMEFSKKRKQATKTQGYVRLSRTQAENMEAVKISQGTVFKTKKDINGEELRYFTLVDTILQQGASTVEVLVEAEEAGSHYNVPAGQIDKSLTYIDGIDEISNGANWIKSEGSDTENDESLRERNLNSWAELSVRPIALKYKNVCEGVEGVLFVRVDQEHPRGQGTVDIIVTGAAGEATQGLLEKVRSVAETIKGEYDNILVKSSTTVTQDVKVKISIDDTASDDGLADKAAAIIIDLFKISKSRQLNELLHADIIYALKEKIDIIENVKVITPSDDLTLEKDKVIILGSVNVEIIKKR